MRMCLEINTIKFWKPGNVDLKILLLNGNVLRMALDGESLAIQVRNVSWRKIVLSLDRFVY